jgi:tetratricopeptide (TPR) repeat protein
VRITAQLVALNPERHVWAASYERDAGDIIGLQREIARAVAREIRATLGAAPSWSSSKNSVNPQAYEFYLRGRERLNDFTTPAFFQAVEYLNQVITLDPDYAPAHASLAVAYTQLGFLSAMPRDQASQKAKQAAERALGLDDGLAEAHSARAFAKFLFDWDWTGPEAEFRRSLELNPNSADAHLLYSIYLTLCGRFDEAQRGFHSCSSFSGVIPVIPMPTIIWLFCMRDKVNVESAQRRAQSLAVFIPAGGSLICRRTPGRATTALASVNPAYR